MGLTEAVREKLRKQMNDVADALATGGASDYAQYQNLVGQVTGLAFAERILLDIEESMDRAEQEFGG